MCYNDRNIAAQYLQKYRQIPIRSQNLSQDLFRLQLFICLHEIPPLQLRNTFIKIAIMNNFFFYKTLQFDWLMSPLNYYSSYYNSVEDQKQINVCEKETEKN